MYSSLSQVKQLHLEISSRCNASCPLCPRNFHGYPFNDGFVERDMTLEEIKQILPVHFLRQIKEIYLNGNFGDVVMNPETVAIVEYFVSVDPTMNIWISTNGGARDADFWRALAKTNAEVQFCIDGLEDTHHLYRQNTLYSTVMRNAEIFIQAGGRAVWKMIDFEHNRHQQQTARELSQKLGFKKFSLLDYGRNQGPVYNKNGQLVHTIGQPKETEFEILFRARTTDTLVLEDITQNVKPRPIECAVITAWKSLYIDSTGDVYPCCFLGLSPKTYGHGVYHQAANAQVKPLIKKNNALEYPLEECIKWFESVSNSWNYPTFEQGRLVICNTVCGKNQ